MRHVRVSVSVDGPDSEVPAMYRVLSSAPYLDTVVGLHWNVSGDRLGLMVYVEGDVDRFRRELSEIPEVLDFETTMVGEGSCYVYLRNVLNDLSQALFRTFTRGSVLVVPPLQYQGDGSVALSLLGPIEEVQAAVADVPTPFTVTVEQVGSMGGAPGLVASQLSERQREAIEAALAVGFYDVPRTGTLDAVAAKLGCSSSTAAEHLQKAESKLIRALFDSRPRRRHR